MLSRPRIHHAPFPLGQRGHTQGLDQPVGFERQRELLANLRQVIVAHRDHVGLFTPSNPEPETFGVGPQVNFVGSQQGGPQAKLPRPGDRNVGRQRHRQPALSPCPNAGRCRPPRIHPIRVFIQVSDHLFRCRVVGQLALGWAVGAPANLFTQRATSHRRQQHRQSQQQPNPTTASSTRAASAH